jgi:hypothetical protein
MKKNEFIYCEYKCAWKIKAALLKVCKNRKCKKINCEAYQELKTNQPKLLTV